MHSFWKQIIVKNILQQKSKNGTLIPISDFQLAKGYHELRLNIFQYFKDFILVTVGIFSAAFGLKGFLLTNHFIDGGATGISLLVSSITNIPLYYLIITINIPFIILGYNIMGKVFAIKTVLAIAGLALCIALVKFPNVTDDNLLVAIFGGIFLGAGIGFSVRGGAVIDGTEVLAIFLSKKFSTSLGDIIIMINVVVFSLGAYLLSVEPKPRATHVHP